MFGLFKKRPTRVMDQAIKAIYGDNPPRKSADVARAVRLAADDLLCGTTDQDRLVCLAKELDAGPIPYSTHDLAVSIALRIFKDADAGARDGLFAAQLTARLVSLEWAKEGKLAPALLAAFENTLYKLYRPGVSDHSQSEDMSAERLGEKFAELLNPTTMLATVQEWYPSAGPKAFVAVASLRIAGFRIGANQRTIVDSVDPRGLAEVHHSLIGMLVDKSMAHDDPAFGPYERVSEIMKLAVRLTEVFYANASSKPPKPIPHWFVGKEVCAFLQNGGGIANPEEIMTFAEFLSESMRATKQLLDELLDAGVRIVPGKSQSPGN